MLRSFLIHSLILPLWDDFKKFLLNLSLHNHLSLTLHTLLPSSTTGFSSFPRSQGRLDDPAMANDT